MYHLAEESPFISGLHHGDIQVATKSTASPSAQLAVVSSTSSQLASGLGFWYTTYYRPALVWFLPSKRDAPPK